MQNFKLSKPVKVIATLFAIVLIIQILIGVYNLFTGNYAANAPFITTGIMLLAAIAVIWLLVYSIWRTWKIFIVFAFALPACNYAKSNQQVVVSTDCGMTWKKINAGDAVPRGTGNPCFMKVSMPNYPLQGDSKFVSNFKEKVRATIDIDYDYSVIEPLAFIQQAKYLGAANRNADDDAAVNPASFETAENSVIDKRIREVAKGILLNEDIVEADQAELESRILTEANKMLEPLGIRLAFITLTFDLDEQTRQAIDVATAAKIYSTRGLDEVGKSVMTARAGATKLTVVNRNVLPGQKEE